MTFRRWADKYFEEADLAESTKAMRRAIYKRDLEGPCGRMKLDEITPAFVMRLCERIKTERLAYT